MDIDDIDGPDPVAEFLSFRGELEGINWAAPPARGARTEALLGGESTGGPSVRAPCLSDGEGAYSWDHIDEGPPETDDSWSAFVSPDAKEADGRILAGGGKKLTKEQKQKLRDQEQLEQARESIRKRGWTEGEVKWRSWLARRGHDTMVNDWNLYRYIEGDCIPPSRDPFWLNSNDVDLPDYEAGNDVPDEEGPMEVTNILGERIEPKWKPPRQVVLKPLWDDVDARDLIERGLGYLGEGYYWRQTLSMVYLEVRVPEGTSARDIQVTIAPTRLTIRRGGSVPIFDEELHMKVYVGGPADDDCSVWELQDKRVVIFHLAKWHRLGAGNVRDSSRTWWRRCFASEPECFPHLKNPHGDYYQQKEK